MQDTTDRIQWVWGSPQKDSNRVLQMTHTINYYHNFKGWNRKHLGVAGSSRKAEESTYVRRSPHNMRPHHEGKNPAILGRFLEPQFLRREMGMAGMALKYGNGSTELLIFIIWPSILFGALSMGNHTLILSLTPVVPQVLTHCLFHVGWIMLKHVKSFQIISNSSKSSWTRFKYFLSHLT